MSIDSARQFGHASNAEQTRPRWTCRQTVSIKALSNCAREASADVFRIGPARAGCQQSFCEETAQPSPHFLIGIYCGLVGCDFLASALLFITGGVPLLCDPVNLPFLAKAA